jgi:hypothetical protein
MAEELAERRRAQSADRAGLEVDASAPQGLVIKHADAAKLRFIVAVVLAVAADAVLVAQQHPKLGAHLVTALARLNVQNVAQRSSLEAGSTREKKGGRSGET